MFINWDQANCLFFVSIKRNHKKVYNNVIKSIEIWAMDTLFMNSDIIEPSEPHVLILQVTNKLDSRIDGNIIALPNLSIY